MPTQDTLRAISAADAAANLSSGALTLAAPAAWSLLGLPAAARVPAAVALVAGGLVHAGAVAAAGREPLATTAAINASWVVAGLGAQALALRPWQRAALGVVAAYDAAITVAKLRGA